MLEARVRDPGAGCPNPLSPATLLGDSGAPVAQNRQTGYLEIESSQASAGGQGQDFKSFSNKHKCNSFGKRSGRGATPLLHPANDTAHSSARVQRSKSAPGFLGLLCVRPPRGRGRTSAREVRGRFRHSRVRSGPSPPASGSLGAPECAQFLCGCVAARHGAGRVVARARRRRVVRCAFKKGRMRPTWKTLKQFYWHATRPVSWRAGGQERTDIL